MLAIGEWAQRALILRLKGKEKGAELAVGGKDVGARSKWRGEWRLR